MPNNAACISCCQQDYATGFQALTNTLVSCACSAGICDSACSTEACAHQPWTPGDACATCLGNSVQLPDGKAGQCFNPVNSACSGDPNCTAYTMCANACPTN
jgi:hypothetical protein